MSGRRIMVMRHDWAQRIADPHQVVECPKCGDQVEADQDWDMGHQDDLGLGGHPLGVMVPEHARCNRSAGGELGALLRPRARRRLSDWLDP